MEELSAFYMKALNEVLEKRFKKSRFSIGMYKDLAACIEETESGWVIYNAERNRRFEKEEASTPLEACLKLFRLLTRDAVLICEMESELVEKVQKKCVKQQKQSSNGCFFVAERRCQFTGSQ